ncbi:MAG: FkbM family methyltransferase [Pseudomonadota bacterium]|nr:FkbM family methyltransferase [Pseudomonadota bacterium]
MKQTVDEDFVNRDWRSDPRFFTLEERIKYAVVPPRLYLRNLVCRRLKKGEEELHVLDRLVRPGSVAIDIGANKGLYSWLLSRIASEVKAFEPNPKMYTILSRSVPDNVETFEIALSDSGGEAELILPIHRNGRYSNQGGTLQAAKYLSGKQTQKWPVRQERLDTYRFSNVSFIKIDVEGFELEVIDGAKEMIQRSKPNLLIEIDPSQNGVRLSDAIGQIEARGYNTYCVSGREFVRFDARSQVEPLTNNFIFRRSDSV